MGDEKATKRSNPETDLDRLLSTNVRHILGKHRHIVTLSHSMTVGEALTELRTHNILSAPVVLSPDAEDDDSGVFMGQVDLHTILQGVIKDAVDPATEGRLVDWERLEVLAKEFAERKLITILGDDVSLKFSGYQSEQDHSLHDVILSGFLCGRVDGPHVVHRVCIFNEHGRITNIVTQSDVVHFLAKHTDQLNGLDRRHIGDLNIISRPAFAVNHDSTVLDAFHTMYNSNHSACAVVDKDGKIVDSISETDLRGLDLGNMGHLRQHVRTFLRREHLKTTERRSEVESTLFPLTCKEGWGLDTVLHKLSSSRVHRLWVVDDQHRPLGVVSLTDIMRLLARSTE